MSSPPTVINETEKTDQLHRGALSLTGAVMQGVIPVSPYPLNIALPLAGGWAVAGIAATVYLMRTERTGWMDKATRVLGDADQAVAPAEQA